MISWEVTQEADKEEAGKAKRRLAIRKCVGSERGLDGWEAKG